MKELGIAWIGLFFVNIIALMFKSINFKPDKIIFSIWAKLLPTQFLLFIIIAGTYSLFNNGSVYSHPKSFLSLFAGSLYLTYAAYSFRYKFVFNKFSWFNGIKINKIISEDVKKIILHKKDKNKESHKFEFVLENNIKKMRNDIGLDNMIEKYAKTNNIPCISNIKN
jgi:hypothetical protein